MLIVKQRCRKPPERWPARMGLEMSLQPSHGHPAFYKSHSNLYISKFPKGTEKRLDKMIKLLKNPTKFDAKTAYVIGPNASGLEFVPRFISQ